MLEGTHYQNAYVTRNLEKAVARVTGVADVRSEVQFEGSVQVMTALGRRTQTLKMAFVWIGDLQYEFIEPVVEAVPVFSTMLPDDDRPRFHHSCARVPDWDDFRRRVDEVGLGEEMPFVYFRRKFHSLPASATETAPARAGLPVVIELDLGWM